MRGGFAGESVDGGGWTPRRLVERSKHLVSLGFASKHRVPRADC
jgi:hypothetical protein